MRKVYRMPVVRMALTHKSHFPSLPPINRVVAEMQLSAYFDYSFQIPLQLDPRENSALSSDECNFLFT